MRTAQLLGLSFVSQKKDDVVAELNSHLITAKSSWLVATPNPEQIMLGRQNKEFAGHLKQMDWLMPDGVGILWASRVLSIPEKKIPERITGLDLVPKLVETARENNRSVLIVGGRDYEGKTIDLKILKRSKDQYEGTVSDDENKASYLTVMIRSADLLKNIETVASKSQNNFGVWWCQGYEDVGAPTWEEEKWLDEVIAKIQPVVVFVALGAPYQEKWLILRRALLSANNVSIGLTVGGAFDVLTGQLPRAPQSWQNLGLEWLWRLIQEPHRWRRQLALIKFVGLVIKTKFTLP